MKLENNPGFREALCLNQLRPILLANLGFRILGSGLGVKV